MLHVPLRATLVKLLRYLLIATFGICALLLVVFGIYAYHAQSTPYGKSFVKGLRYDVNITFDQSDIPHIEAKTSNDALFALGYLHARERGWQLEFNRRLASGSLSEIFGEKTLGVDRFIRTIGIRSAARLQYENLSRDNKLSLEAYANGVNASFSDLGWALPVEFLLTNTRPGLWTPIDSISWLMMMALDLGDNWSKELIRLQLSSIMPTEDIWQVLPPYPGDPIATKLDFAKLYRDQKIFLQNPATTSASLTKKFSLEESMYTLLPQGLEGKGSNNWVLAGDKTTSGKPILANDPHLGLTSPSTWYFAHLKSNDMNVIGGSIPGLPGIILGHTNKVAWGFTNTAGDVQDLFIEKISENNPAKYKTPKGQNDFKLRRETIAIKGQASQTMLVRETNHGPVISDVHPALKKIINADKYVVSFQWTALSKNNQSMSALLAANKANSINELKEAFSQFYAPMQNIVMADTDGKIAFMVAGSAPKRLKQTGMVGVAPVFGWEAHNEWDSRLTPNELPQDFSNNASWIATANQKVENTQLPFTLTADWSLPYRHDRIEDLIKAKAKHDLASNRLIQLDTMSNGAKPLLSLFKATTLTHPLSGKVKPIIESFNGEMLINDAGALLFNVWVDQLTRLVYQPKLDIYFDEIYRQRSLREGLTLLLEQTDTSWCDVASTPAKESCRDLSPRALQLALDYLSNRYGSDPSKWQWGQAHMALAEHRPFSNVPILKHIFELKAPMAGDTFTINVGRMNFSDAKQPYAVNVAAGMRVIYDLDQLDQSIFMSVGGQSGWVQSLRYRNYMGLWSKEQYLPMAINPTQEMQGTLILKAK